MNADKKQEKLGNRNGKKNKYMDISWNKQGRHEKTREDMNIAKKGKSQERNWISSTSSTK